MITKEQVKKIAQLARLEISEKEIEHYQKELSSILDYVEKLKEVDVSNIQPMSHPLKIKNVVREDKEIISKEISKKLLNLAPAVKNNYLKTKQVF